MAILQSDMLLLVDPPRRRYRFNELLLPADGAARAEFIASGRTLLRLIMEDEVGEEIDIDPTSIEPDASGWRSLP